MGEVQYFICIFLALFVHPSKALEFTYSKQTATDKNSNVCGHIRCVQTVNDDIMSIWKLQIFDIALNGSVLATVTAIRKAVQTSGEFVLVSRTFNKQQAALTLGLTRDADCIRGSFMCEVGYIDHVGNRQTDVAIVRASSAASSGGGCGHEVSSGVEVLQRSLSRMLTTKLEEINNTMGQYVKSVQNECLNPDKNMKREWRLAFRGTAGVGKSVYLAYKDGVGIPAEVEEGCKQVAAPLPCTNHYRNNAVMDNWSGISEVAFAVYKNNVKVKQVIFDGRATNYMSWFDRARIQDSSWIDLRTTGANVFSIVGIENGSHRRRMYMNHVHNACHGDYGWFAAIDNTHGGCPWENNLAFPVFKYSTLDRVTNWISNVDTADFIAIFVRYFSVP
ncbi:uncharacterized protein LOC131936502 [Physella acuta]|uniref:uncharacterized protein LOC131936502 n=1 Tax=Physella acuta TaxID=109671 RepID=UPI0027DB039C|nr:uncharacterized protein LOC131936502 [Physella acuta]